MTKHSIDWEVVHYGTCFEKTDKELNDGILTQKLYYYQERYFVEVWWNGIRLSFNELY